MKIFIKKYRLIFAISILTYLVFFIKLIFPNQLIYSGKDSVSFHYPSRIYLSERLKEDTFPYWTERMFLGFPIYADMERGYLNPINILLVKYLGSFYSYKALHFGCYLVGSISLYFFLKKYKVNYLGYAISNLVYYFSFFLLYHQQHFNMILTAYLFPTGLLLFDKYISTKKLKFSLLTSLLLAFCFYLGSFQFVFLFLLLLFFYLLSQVNLKEYKFFVIHTFIWFLILILPGLFSTYNLYIQSARISNTEYTQGSFTPSMIINLIFPFLFNYSDNYMGSIISTDYFMHETYIYIGISSFIFAILGYLTMSDKRLKRFINYLTITFFILAFIKSIPLIRDINLFPISLFRYWVRSVILLNISISIILGIFISRFDELVLKVKSKDFKIFLFPVVYLIILELINYKKTDIVTIGKLLLRDDYIFGFWYIAWTVILILSFILIKFIKKKELIAGLIIFDILFFGLIGTHGSLIKDKKDFLNIPPNNSSIENIRVIDLSNTTNGDNALLTKAWTLSGYSVLYPKSVEEKLKDLHLDSIRYPRFESGYEVTNDFYTKAQNLGVQTIVNDSSTFVLLNTPLVMGNHLKFSGATQEEGNISFNIEAIHPTIVNTYIRNYPGWEVLVEGKKIDIHKDAMFISFDVQKGRHNIQMKYIPKDLYNGIRISIALSLLLGGYTYVMVKKKRVWEF